MNTKSLLWAAATVLVMFFSGRASAAVFYVDVNSTNPVPPYATWGTASTDIQSAIDASSDGDLILVTNGVYQTGGGVDYRGGTNRVIINKGVKVQSVNGPALTSILGYANNGGNMPTNGPNSVRCAFLTNNACLNGFTLAFGSGVGGGVWCYGTNASLTDCLLVSNTSGIYGSGLVTNCVFSSNVAGDIADYSVLTRCIFTNNQSMIGYNSTFYNCLIAKNNSPGNVLKFCRLVNCTVVTNIAEGGLTWVINGINLCNCIVYYNYPFGSGEIYMCYITNSCYAAAGFGSEYGNISNAPAFMDWANGDYRLRYLSPGMDAGLNTFAPPGPDLLGNSRVVNGTVDMGAYENQNNPTPTFSNMVHYVSQSYAIPTAPYTNWLTAASNLQSAIAVANSGDIVAAGPGVYIGLGTVLMNVPPALTNRIVLTNGIELVGVYGARSTLIVGGYNTRCAYVGSNSVLSGFTLTNGQAPVYFSGFLSNQLNGGGVWCDPAGLVLNCVFYQNTSLIEGGGLYGGTARNCIFSGNSATEDGGGGVSSANLYNCTLFGNSGGNGGGGYVQDYGTTNVIYNTIIYSNSGGNVQFHLNSYTRCFLTNCCTAPLPVIGAGNFTNQPMITYFGSSYQVGVYDFHLASNSPCINAGNNLLAVDSYDLDGSPRIAGGTVDVGAYEYPTPASIVSYVYLQNYRLPTDGSVDFADLDGTGFTVWQDWIAGLNPTNPASVLAMLTPVATTNPVGVVVSWESVTNREYYLQRSVNLGGQPAFSAIQSNLLGQAGTTSYTDTSATNGGPYFYRVGVQ